MPSPLPRSWRAWALVASLGLNLVFVGLILGAVWRGPPPPPFPGLGFYVGALPEPYRDDIARALRDKRGEWVGVRDALRTAEAELTAALTADPYASAAVAAALERRITIGGTLAERGRVLLVEQIDRMSPDERAAYAAALRAQRDHDRGPPRHERGR